MTRPASEGRSSGRIVVLGCGYAGLAVTREARAQGREALATTRSDERAAFLEAQGLSVALGAPVDLLSKILMSTDCVIVTFPPDGATDARTAEALRDVASVVYISSTGVYGEVRGVIDGDTPTEATSPRIAARLAAESAYREIGGIILRAPAIYGPGRGLHERLRRGDFRMPGDGQKVVSRIHVDDLALLAIAASERAAPGAVFTMGDDTPVPQREVIAWLCEELGVPMPLSAPLDQVDETLRHDRCIDGSIAQRELGVSLRYPSYREGFRACLRSSE